MTAHGAIAAGQAHIRAGELLSLVSKRDCPLLFGPSFLHGRRLPEGFAISLPGGI